ncbi:MAG: peptidoglycan-binding protein [Ruminococcus sp.]|nr:peptidoglycan-binding protein [Ruminococcus sp.]
MKKFKKIISIIMIAAVIASIVAVSTVSSSASGTGVGLAEWALNAYYSKWSYVYGGATPGAVDCSGLIYSYAGGYRVGDAQTFNSDYRYSLSGSIPNIHGLGLYKPGHVGVYVGNGMAVDARGTGYGVCYESVWSHGWTQYFKVPGVSYPDTGWVEFDGDYYYYENGEYLSDTTRTIDGTIYTFASSGKSTSSPSSSGSTDSASSSSSDSGSNDTGSLKKGSSGSRVEKLQQRLLDLGYYNGTVDGDFGEATETAFKLFQEKMGLYVDGVAGSDADYLYADDAPAYQTAEEETDEEETITSEKEDLAETGAADEEDEEASAMSYTVGDYSDDIYQIQERLIGLGYLEGEADGEFGDMTAVAVKGFQTANGLEATGIVEQTTYDKLFSDEAVAAKKEEAKPDENTAVTADANTPAIANTSNNAVQEAPAKAAPKTDIEKDTTELSSKSVAAVTDNSLFKRGANATNFEFLIWLAVMIVVLMITFAVVYAIERKKQRAAYRARRFQ